jgi:hypothetical protein
VLKIKNQKMDNMVEEFGKFKGPNEVTLKNLPLISRDEADTIMEQEPLKRGKMKGAVGIGFIRIEDTTEEYWVAVDRTNMPLKYCPRHGKKLDTPLSLQAVREDTMHNIKMSAFYKCNGQIRISKNSTKTTKCDFNIYPYAETQDFEQKWQSNANNLWVLEADS